MALISVTNTKKKNLIIFIHGFIGGKETWIREDGAKSILDYLKEDITINSIYDFAVFDYYTEFTHKIDKAKAIIARLFGRKTNPTKNIDVENIAQMLKTEIKYLDKDIKNIVLIAHSMGGLVAKSMIIENILEKNKSNVNLYVSLAVPHRGSNLATFGKIIFSNPQLENLQPLNEKIHKMNEQWLQLSEKLPKTLYFQAKYDDIVPNIAAVSFDNRKVEVDYTDDDHIGIVRPKQENDIVLKSLKFHLFHLLSEKNNSTAFEISNSSFRNKYYEQIWQKLNGLRVYFEVGMSNDIQRHGNVNPQPVFDFINSIAESRLFIEKNIYDNLALLYEDVSRESNSKIAEPMIRYLKNKDKLTSNDISKIERGVNEARSTIVSKIGKFMSTNESQFH
jgi:uncharacterized alpha/beta hydrolase family protein